MKIVIEGGPKEIAALVVALQERQDVSLAFVPETADGPYVNCAGVEKGR